MAAMASPPLTRRKLRRKAQERLRDLFEGNRAVFAIHYACESWFDTEGRTSRTTAIAIYEFSSGQSRIFSVVHAAELRGIAKDSIREEYERIEKGILQEYFQFIREHEGALWVHWHMRSTDYGFRALEHRARVLDIEPVLIDDSRKVNLAGIIRNLEGDNYIGDPHLSKLLDKNNIKGREFREGSAEAEAFNAGDYLALHRSALSKVEAIYGLAELAASEALLTDAKWWVRHGLTPRDIAWALIDHWSFHIVMFLFGAGGLAWGVSRSF